MSIPNCLLERELDPLGAEPHPRLAELALLLWKSCVELSGVLLEASDKQR